VPEEPLKVRNMAENLIDQINSYVTPDLISKAAASVHASPGSTSAAMSSTIATLLGRITSLASTPPGATQLSGLLSSGNYDGSILKNLPSLFGGGAATTAAVQQGQGLLSTLFGGKLDAVTAAIAGHSGMPKSSAASLMALAAPLVMGALGRLRAAQGLDPAGLANMLNGQRATITAAIPQNLTHLTSLDTQGLEPLKVTPMAARAGTGRRWLLLLLIPVVGFLIYLLGRGRPEPAPVAAVAPTAPVAAVEQVKLCGGESASLTTGSFNYNLARFLEGGDSAELPKTFVFDNLNFDSGTTKLTPDSERTVSDLIVILKACPNAQVELTGHTDNTGDAAANQTLSTTRAAAIEGMLVAGGIGSDRIKTSGYGQDRPVASNDTEEGKARNRRTELTVLKK
jgi:OmpA-OmpF porin, OOP family